MKNTESKAVREKLKDMGKKLINNVSRSPSYWKGHRFLVHISKILFILAFISI